MFGCFGLLGWDTSVSLEKIESKNKIYYDLLLSSEIVWLVVDFWGLFFVFGG